MKKYIIIILSIFLVIPSRIYALDVATLTKCIDGDTFKANVGDKEYTIRMLAIDTPELANNNNLPEYYATEASEYTCKKLTNAKKITLEYDENSDKFDKYNRLLAWVFVDNTLLEEELVARGYAKVAYLYDDYKYANILKEKQEIASAKNIGIWDSKAKSSYEKNPSEEIKVDEKTSNIEIIILTFLFLLVTLITSIFSKKK